MNLARLVLLGVVCVAGVARGDALSLLLADGDLIFHTSKSAQSEAVAIATGSKWTHMGLVLFEQGELWVYEAVQPVKRTKLREWVARGAGGRAIVRRLREASTVLTPSVQRELHKIARSFVGRPYDLQFRWDDDQLYCSELVYKAYERAANVRIGKTQRAGELQLASPLVQKKLKQRYGKKLQTFDASQTVITPQAMFDDPALVTVFAN